MSSILISFIAAIHTHLKTHTSIHCFNSFVKPSIWPSSRWLSSSCCPISAAEDCWLLRTTCSCKHISGIQLQSKVVLFAKMIYQWIGNYQTVLHVFRLKEDRWFRHQLVYSVPNTTWHSVTDKWPRNATPMPTHGWLFVKYACHIHSWAKVILISMFTEQLLTLANNRLLVVNRVWCGRLL